MKQKLFLIFSFVQLMVMGLAAQTLTANAPQQVAPGQQFRLTYTVNSHDVSGFHIGQIPADAFEVLMGPSTSRQSSFSMVNGKTSQTSTITYTYILSALKNGTFTIPPATIMVEGNQVTSNTVKIQVTGQPQQQGSSQQGRTHQGNQPRTETRPSGTPISGSDLFIRVSASKKRVVEQEPVLLTYKVYTLVSLTQLEGKMPDLKGFHTQEVPLPQEKSFKVEEFNGRQYKTVTWSQYVMFPQITGKLQIPSITFNGIVMQQNRYVDPFEAFFNGGSGYTEVKKAITAPGVEIQVDPLPDRPAGFSGGVGRLNVKAEIDKTEVKANDPITLKVTVSGIGNLQLLKQPDVKFPKDFDVYDPKTTDKTRLTANGVEGSVVYEFLAVPRHQGKFEIPALEYIYFDTQERAYKTLTTDAFQLDVAKGEGGESSIQDFTRQEDVQMLAKDIRHIKLGNVRQQADGEHFFASSLYWGLMALLVLVFITLFVVFRQRAISNADVVKTRAGKANKVAVKRLKKAARLMHDNKPDEFYDEALRALWGYVGDKLNINVEQLSRENIAERLKDRQVDEETVGQFIEAIDECEFERYAPGDPKGNMEKVYDKAITAIEKIEGGMKRTSKKKTTVVTLLLLLGAAAASAATKAEADSAYVDGRYQQAAEVYEQLLSEGVSPELYYNLGNCYYRMEEMPQAILAYERSLRLAPGDADIRFNLQMARSKTVDKIVPESEMFFVTWYRSVVNMTSADGWGRTALVALALAIVLLLIYLFTNPLWLRKLGFFGGLAMLVLLLVSNIFAWQQMRQAENRSGAIIFESAVPVKSTPTNNGTDLFILHEGTRVDIIDQTMNDWREIRVPDGKQGWVETKQIEVI